FGLAMVADGFAAEEPAAPPRERSSSGAVDQLPEIDTAPSSPGRWSTGDTVTFTRPGELPSVRGSSHPEYLIGTALYMAPELWRGEPATRRSDLYSLGILLYELLAGNTPHCGIPMAVLGDVIQNRDVPRLGDIAPAVEPALAAIVDRLVERDAGARFTSAEALVVALEECAAPTPATSVPDGNPYRGLAAFESAHAAMFFGRRSEIRELV